MSDNSEKENSSSLASISEGAGIFLAGRICSNLISIVVNVILTRSLGAYLYGIFSYQSILFQFFRIFTTLGSENSILRFLPEYEDDRYIKHMIISLASLTSLFASIVVAVIIYYTAPWLTQHTINDSLFTRVLRIAALVLPFNTLADIITSIFKAEERMDYNVGVKFILKPITRLVFVGGAVLLGYSIIGATAALVLTGIIVFFGSFMLLVCQTNLAKIQQPTSIRAKEYYNFSIPLIFNQIGSVFYNKIDILMVGLFLSGSAVGVYNIAVTISSFISLPLLAFGQLFPPIVSRLNQNGKTNELELVYATVTRWILTVSLFPGIAAIVYADSLLHVFGPKFAEGQLVLILFTFAQLTNCMVGPSGFVLMMSDHQYLTMANQLSAGIINIILNYIFITQLGFVGAAVATASVLATINLLRVGEVWYFERIMPYNQSYAKPLLSGIISGVILYVISLFYDQYLLLIVGGSLGGLAYLLVLYSLGFEEDEKRIFKDARIQLMDYFRTE